MPRVSDAHLEARREQILDAAQRQFAQNGFHATSMQDVIIEAGLSVGAVYRYFKSKEELRMAVAERAVGAIGEELAQLAAGEPLPLDEAMIRVISIGEARVGDGGAGRIAVQAWAEALRDPELAAFVGGIYATLRGHFVTLARRSQQAGYLTADADPEAVGSALFVWLPGYVVQRVLPGGLAPALVAEGFRGLFPVDRSGSQ